MAKYSVHYDRTSSVESTGSDNMDQTDQLSPTDIENRFMSKICQALSLDETENESRIIAKQLLVNGRQELFSYRDNIAPIDFENQMDNEWDSSLLKILKNYFQYQWEQLPFDWFRQFITEQKTSDDDNQYQQVLKRTAEYRDKFTKECPVFSIVLQLIFIFDDDIDEYETLFNNVWNIFVMNGYTTALEKLKKYILRSFIDEHEDSDNNPLYLALCEYFREPILFLFKQSKIVDRQNLLVITLDSLANGGWTKGLYDKKVMHLIAPANHKSLLANLQKYLVEKGLPSLSVIDPPVISQQKIEPFSRKESPKQNSIVSARRSPSPPSDIEDEPKNDPLVVYMPSLPSQITDNQTLEDMIRQCLNRKYRQDVIDVECNIYLGIGRVYLHNKEDRDHLINVIKSIILDTDKDEESITIKFTMELELISYVVIETMNNQKLPHPNDILQRWTQFYKVSRPIACEQLAVQFPNIFRIVSTSLDEIIPLLDKKEFSIDRQCATVYFRADCCFFEELPPNISEKQLEKAMLDQLSQQRISKDSFYIQYNKETANAVILTYGKARPWALFNSINLDKRVFMKKSDLARRLLLWPIPKTLSVALVKNHSIFQNTIDKFSPEGDCLILELSDKNVYEKCVNHGALRVDDHLLHMEVYTGTGSNPVKEIDLENWYKPMMGSDKPNIVPFINNRSHSIFHWKWNAQAFREQLQRYATGDRSANMRKNERDYGEVDHNQKRHWLRVAAMLNTIGVVWKGSYCIGEHEIKIHEDRLKTIVYNHESKLERGKTMLLSDVNKYPYTSTIIKVVDEDCLYVYQRLVAEKCRPVLLNMANAESPGGGYRKGDGAQEETLFRRSNYFRSLDINLDNGKPTNRFFCISNCESESLLGTQRMYPMDKYGAIYTSGLTVFRQAEDTGYNFMDEPLYDVCSIAIAAHRDPEVKNNRLTSKYSIRMRKKIENIFAIAYHHKHDSLVLSAFGCGAFKNPPEHVAAIFRSVAEQYAGFFKQIYFAIVDDHNTGLQFNPQGNYRPFRQLLHDMELKPTEHKLQDMMIGPWRILNMPDRQQVTLSDIRICYLKLCNHGAKCNDLENMQHCGEYSHPPLCPSAGSSTTCKLLNNEDHVLWFVHQSKCPHGGQCPLVRDDPKHATAFEHPQYCRDRGHCNDMNAQHLKAFRHVPICKHGMECLDFNRKSANHCRDYRHSNESCQNGGFCTRFHDQQHLMKKSHPFPPPCPLTPFHCPQYIILSESSNIRGLSPDIQNHCLQYSHVCRFGRQCRDPSEVHWEKTIHIARIMCTNGNKCTKTDQEDHLNSFSHPEIADIRRLCHKSANDCKDRRSYDHIIKYRHSGTYDPSGVIRCYGFNTDKSFVQNQQNMIEAINTYTTKKLSIPTDILTWVRGLQPVHRCKKVIFESILVHGHVMSRQHMDNLKKPRFVAQAVQQHKNVRVIFDRYKSQAIEDHSKDYIQAIVSNEYAKKPKTSSSKITVVDEEYDTVIGEKERILADLLTADELDTVSRCSMEVAEASWNLHHTPLGIGYAPDKALGTDRHVFSVLGPNLGHYYGDIFLIFKSELMLHPDTNFSPQAATSFSSGNTFTYRPWVKDSSTSDGRIRQFHQSTLHCSVPGYEYAAAAELMSLTETKKKIADVNLKDIQKYWTSVDSHQVLEGHLPQLVPLDYIEEVYIPKNLFAILTPAAQESAKTVFRDSLHITHHEVELDPAAFSGGGAHPSVKVRGEYQNYVIDKLLAKFNRRMKSSQYVHGIAITIAPSQFTDHILLPVTISEAADEYTSRKKKASTDDIYIYWESLCGDMMVTISDEPIDPVKKQPDMKCLVSYIAERPSLTTSDYHELYSYLNAEPPYRHVVVHNNRKFISGSNSFYRGCNMDDYLTYCLQIERTTGMVTLSQAGPNSIYNHEKISHKFTKTTLDLNQLNYIHVSAGSQKVSIRNLVICFEPISHLHPSFDKEFEMSNIPLSNAEQAKTDVAPNNNESPSLLSYVVDAYHKYVRNKTDSNDESTKLIPCPDSINCLEQENNDHIKKHSHPCRFAELCRQKDKEPYLTHELRTVDECHAGEVCQKLDNPVHRAQYRHSGMPDFLIPCRHQQKCHDKSYEHRIKYSHGENIDIHMAKKVPAVSPAKRSQSPVLHRSHYETKSDETQKRERIPCWHGLKCRDIHDAQHCFKYSHDNKQQHQFKEAKHRTKYPCRYGVDCRKIRDPQHCSEYSHPD